MKTIPAVTLFIAGSLIAAPYTAALGSATVAASPRQAAGQRRSPAKKPAAPHKPAAPPKLPCGDPFAFEVLLDRQNFSPGEIDGKLGTNAAHAIAALQAARGLEPTGDADCDAWHALGGDTSGSMVATYTIEKVDVNGPFAKKIPNDLQKQAPLPALSYRSALERLAERFHVSPALLRSMNRRLALRAGAEMKVPAVTPFDVDAKAPRTPQEPDVTIQVTRDDSGLRAIRPDGTVILFAPVTTGSEHDPLPVGNWKVTSVDWHPAFHYNPELFWDANPKHAKATIKPGPNNPVGVVWIGLDLEHYGLHGTPEPSRIGYTESHGCIRLTNWDAARVASIVKRGTPVLFR
jgi:lipoprotein-anchoring transpeptidase ErfK/SrfK